jgi:hypothetical protein
VKREQLEHVLRAASRVVGERDLLVIGSQSILGSFAEDELPEEATRSIEVDLAFFDDPDDTKADAVDGAIGELSRFHESNGYYGQGVSLDTAVLPVGWRDRLIAIETPGSAPARGHCLDPHDCAVSKLVAGRSKDHDFVGALLRVGLLDADVLLARIDLLEVAETMKAGLRGWVERRRRQRSTTP